MVLNARFGWNLPTESLAAIVLTAISLIIAIAVEDAAAKKAHIQELLDDIEGLVAELQEKSDVAGTAARPAAGGAENSGAGGSSTDAG